jgi:hypothetical protein
MKISLEQLKEMELAAKPLVEWLTKNGDPHSTITIDASAVVLSEGIASTPVRRVLKL